MVLINPMDLCGRTVMVTGASSGLGKATVVLLAQLGAKVILVARGKSRLVTVAESLVGQGHAVEDFDLNQIDDIPSWMKLVAARHGTLSGLVHSAGIMITKPLRMQTESDWNYAMRINVIAGLALAKGFRQREVYCGTGSLVFITSVMGQVGQPGQVLYSATKGAIISMVRSMALELTRDKIRVNCIAPALVVAGLSDSLFRSLSEPQIAQIIAMHPLGLGKVEDVAYAAAFLIADTSRWITGTTLTVDGGYTAH